MGPDAICPCKRERKCAQKKNCEDCEMAATCEPRREKS